MSTTAFERLDLIKNAIARRDSLIHLNGSLGLTKTKTNFSDGTFLRDLDLERDVDAWLTQRKLEFSDVLMRYQAYDPSLQSFDRPQHFPVRLLKGLGSIASGKNIFLFFPNCLGVPARDESDVIGFEFVDVWHNLFLKSVLPCWSLVGDEESLFPVATELCARLEKTISLASLFHEVGHRVGPYRVSPAADPRLKLSTMNVDILGELATDTLLLLNLPEFPEIEQFVVLQRLFWFSRRGFLDNPRSAIINEDNDAWIGAFLFNRYLSSGAITETNGRLRFDWSRFRGVFEAVLRDIDQLGSELVTLPPAAQNAHANAWRAREVEQDPETGQFELPEGMIRVFSRCVSIPEIPHFQPVLSLGV